MVSEREIAEFGDLWSLMYFVFAKEMLNSFGDEGENALRRAIRKYGKMRGERLRDRHLTEGLPINLLSLFEHYDLPNHPDNKGDRKVLKEDKLLSYIYDCPYQKIWSKYNADYIGRIYCEEFHHAMWQAYSSDIKVEIPKIITKGDSHCKFVVTQQKQL